MTAAATVGDPVVQPSPWYRRPVAWTWVATAATLVLYAVLGWQRRWMSDDGLLVLRTVREILAGHGPVFNVGERVEASTSPLWTWLLAGFGAIPGPPLEWVAVVVGLLCAVGGLFFGLDGARRLYGAAVAPAGALVVCVLPPFRDFATSGLETGLALLWLGGSWWLLVRGKAPVVTALVLGLGPLVRPDLALFSVVGFVALLLLRRPKLRTALGWLAAAVALPVGYQVFRMGYYGLLVPNTALAKEAGDADWPRGFAYLADLVTPYLLWLPLLLLIVVAALVRRSRILTLAPVVAAVLLTAYVVRVGGDFMHGRMLLPALFVVLLPVMAVPLTRRTVALVVAVWVWAVAAGGWLRVPYENDHLAVSVTDERSYWSWATGKANPVLATDFLGQDVIHRAVDAVAGTRDPAVLVYSYGDVKQWFRFPTDLPYVTLAADSMGAISNMVSVDVRVHDGYGLASDLAAHSASIPGGRPGHSKWLVGAWEIAAAGRGDLAVDGQIRIFQPAEIDAARAALRCPAEQDVLTSTRGEMSWSRFIDNFAGAWHRTEIRYPRDPGEAARC
ncbi:beta-(1-_2)-arabinofuranosyltransferase [Amycolatopsis ultiminotia]|uniref:Beta-(1->2)-arabinofuranosyltransferase n=1 Tax=Amycolatopsis ultiminotia TaxID=543629 RepID=A0ABP6VEC8_9PSEU